MHKRRQRRVPVLALMVSALVMAACGCSQAAQNDARTAATAVAGLSATAQPAASRAATAVAGLSATAQPVASEVGRRIGNLDPADVGRLIGTVMGSNVEITIEPSDVPNAEVTH